MMRRGSHLGSAVALAAGAAVLLLLLAAASRALWPGAEGRADRLAPVLVVALAVTVVVVRSDGLRAEVFARPHRAGLPALAVVAVLAVLPLVGGWATPPGLVVLVVGYAATGLWEEGFYRGVLFRVLSSWGPAATVWWTSAFFGATHLTNVVYGQPWAVSLAQSVGAFCFGVGYGAVRLRLASVWPLMVAHAASDLFMQASALSGGAWWAMMVGRDVVLLVVGLVVLRRGSEVAAAHRPLAAS